ncbi:MAG: HAMP domain-containing histidine kinase, partial [Arcobacteraceae bacterium]|nr:HAMP domain-containing histidine kinase [Arcobacteraceae bacterium]
QVIMNILNNAKDILIEKGIEKKVVYIETIQVNNNCTIKIYDNAGGIAKEIISKVFDPYFTTKHQRQGTGIGLHMSSEIIVKHFNGTLSATNEYFKIKDKRHYGACFCINIPLS